MPVPITSTLSRALLTASILTLAIAASTSAQPRKSNHDIRVYTQGSTCYYQIDEQQNQDLFRIAPGGGVRFYANQGSAARMLINIEVQNDASGRSGAQGNGRASLQTGKPVATIKARNAIGQTTQHPVRIQCCLNATGNQCPNWLEAQPYTGSTSGLGPQWEDATWSIPVIRTAAHGPFAPDELTHDERAAGVSPEVPRSLPRPLPGGGPVMEVEED